MNVVTFRLSPETLALVDALAKQEGRTRSAMIARILWERVGPSPSKGGGK